MPEIQPFNFHGNQVRVVMVDGDPWWVAVDVCQVLEIKDARQAAARLDQEDRCQTTVLDARGVAQDKEHGTLGELFERPVREHDDLVEGLLGKHHNATLAAQYKAGKTTFGLNLVRSLVDGCEFLGRKTRLEGRVAWFNGEMDCDDFVDYARPMGWQNVADLEILNLRGRSLNLQNDAPFEWAVQWLSERRIQVLVMDSWRMLCSWAGIKEQDNTEVGALTARIDELKQRSGVSAVVVLVHMGRAEQEQGAERARGATALDDWVDARWVLTRQKSKRFLSAEGRRVELEETELEMDQSTRNLFASGGDREQRKRQDGIEAVRQIVAEVPPESLTTTELKRRLGADEYGYKYKNREYQEGLVQKAEEAGVIIRVPGDRNAKLVRLAPAYENEVDPPVAGGSSSDGEDDGEPSFLSL